jgi:hypothetical protein
MRHCRLRFIGVYLHLASRKAVIHFQLHRPETLKEGATDRTVLILISTLVI